MLGGNPRKLMGDGEARAVSPDGSQIAFVRGTEMPQSIWVMDEDGGHARKLVGQTYDTFGPVAWSPDNRKFAFVRYFIQPPDHLLRMGALETYNFDNGATNSILYDPGLWASVAWTRDNRLIYSLHERSSTSADSNLWVVPLDPRTGTVRGPAERLTDSPDGKVLASVSDSGKALTYLGLRFNGHLYVAKVPRKGEANEAPTRMKLDEGDNYPFTWTPDGESVIFASTRDGVSHLYKQGIYQPTPDLLVGGHERVWIARISPDRSEILYGVWPVNGNQDGQARILAIPLSGGSPRGVLRGNGIWDFQCARAPANVCIMTQTTGEKTQYSTFDPKTGLIKAALTIQGGISSESFSPDGTTLAAVPAGSSGRIPAEIQLYSLRDGSRTTLKLKGWGINFGLDWNPDGKSLWINANNSKNVMAVVNVDLQGNVTPLFEDRENQVGWAVPSPDGSRVAYYKAKFTSDVWLLRDF